ncbi:Small-conductance mechanosensitive channel [Catalinimonas alkaloidigena]|uniref:Small-conductance mechanosensitive channel n=1 Tax=Catalinimonas alkaloidigena TaxID=1075417 RepID=A0A1G9T2A9_9BACT|nr:mechanosensitive ion channel family protein [Catalinimonas alkaloidigena]SDM41747.1 Small-conductance mechanosensitive channel [Catalinimonas alkaloidigena]
MQETLERIYFNNSVQAYLIAAAIILIGMIVVKAFKDIVYKRLKKLSAATDSNIDDYVIESIGKFGIPILYFLVIYIGLRTLTFSARVTRIIEVATTVVITFFAIRFIATTILLLLRTYVRKQENGEEKVKQLGGIIFIVNVVVWGIGLLFLLDNIGFDVTAMIAGLGIGGIAIALAAQNILGDLFNYFVIFFDRPFEIGDFIIIDNKMGSVEYIGLKTTRVKSLSGEQLVFSNSDLTSSRIHNYKRMQRRRIVFQVTVIYQTSLEQLKEIPKVLRAAVEAQENVLFDRAHFASYGDSSLNFEIVYNVLTGDYNQYMDIQQAINLRIFEEFQRLGVEFAYPTRTLYLAGQTEENPLAPKFQ